MKKTVFTAATLVLLPGLSHAQSSVTLFGIIDTGIAYTSNAGGHAVFQETSSNEQGSRWGLSISEDLGGGIKTIAQLENGFSSASGTLGQGGRMLGRQAWVGLASSAQGAITVGRQYNPLQDTLEPLQIADSAALTQYATHPLDNDDLDNTFRTSNAIKYVSPKLAGLQAEAMYAFSNSSSFSVNRSYGFGASYSAGPLSLGAAYARMDHPAFNGDTAGAIPADNYYNATTLPALASATTVQQWGVGGTYALGSAIIGLLYTGSSFGSPKSGSLFGGITGAGGGTGGVRFGNFDASVRYLFTPYLLASLGETYTHVSQDSNSGNYWQTNVGVQYLLSKRTDLFVDVIYQKTSNSLHAWIGGAGSPSSTRAQVISVAGIRHRF